MDEFDKKRDVVKSLMSMLHSNANDEMSKHLGAKPDAIIIAHGEPGHDPMCKGGCAGYNQGGTVEDPTPQNVGSPSPNNQDGTYHADSSSQTYRNPQEGYSKGGMVDLTKNQSLMQPTSMDRMMSDGGMAMASDQPEDEMKSDLVPQMGGEHEGPSMGEGDPAKVHETSIEDEDEENNQSAFHGLLKRKK